MIDNKHSTEVDSSPPPRGVIVDKHSINFVSPPPAPRVRMSIHTEGKSCSDIGLVLVLNDRPSR